MTFIKTSLLNPPQNVFVHTKICDEKGETNKQIMERRVNLWFTQDWTYVYYTPTHWAYIDCMEMCNIIKNEQTWR